MGGQRGAQIYQLDHIPLTPGPLVVVIKVAASQVKNTSGFWPPSLPDAIETIAASYGTPPLLAPDSANLVPLSSLRLISPSPLHCVRVFCFRSSVDTDPSSKVRLFNLAPGTISAGMTLSGKPIATNVAYGVGSSWMKVATVSSAFSFVDDVSKKTLATKTVTPAAAPVGNTEVLLGLQSGGGAGFGTQVVSLVDAPEGGTCHP